MQMLKFIRLASSLSNLERELTINNLTDSNNTGSIGSSNLLKIRLITQLKRGQRVHEALDRVNFSGDHPRFQMLSELRVFENFKETADTLHSYYHSLNNGINTAGMVVPDINAYTISLSHFNDYVIVVAHQVCDVTSILNIIAFL